MRCFLVDTRTPGPCPVDDAPHTTCTSPDYDPTRDRGVVVVSVRRPRVLDLMVPPVAETTSVTVQTSQWRRRDSRLRKPK
jgi:hypothetical protein